MPNLKVTAASDGTKWQKYIEWSGLTQLVELLSLDPMLCPPILGDVRDQYWPHIVNENFMLAFFLDADFLRQQVSNIHHKNLLCFFEIRLNPRFHRMAHSISLATILSMSTTLPAH